MVARSGGAGGRAVRRENQHRLIGRPDWSEVRRRQRYALSQRKRGGRVKDIVCLDGFVHLCRRRASGMGAKDRPGPHPIGVGNIAAIGVPAQVRREARVLERLRCRHRTQGCPQGQRLAKPAGRVWGRLGQETSREGD